MSPSHSLPKMPMNWQTFQTLLTAYVTVEFQGEDPALIYPQIAYFIEVSPQCEAAYYEEFQRQGEQIPVEELRQLNATENLETLFALFDESSASTEQIAPHHPEWIEELIEEGKVWIDKETNRWQQLLITLDLGLQKSDNRQALAGLMSMETAADDTSRELMRIGDDESGIEAIVSVRPDSSSTVENPLHALDIIVTQQDIFGDLSGVNVSLCQGENRRHTMTDSLGRATFEQIVDADLHATEAPLQVLITLPDD